MDLIQIVVVLVVVGVLMWAVNQHLPMQPPYKQLINVVVLLAVCLWLLYAFGLIPGRVIVTK